MCNFNLPKAHKRLRDYTNIELISRLDQNDPTDLEELAALRAELLRRMNEKTPIFPNEEIIDWGNPIIP